MAARLRRMAMICAAAAALSLPFLGAPAAAVATARLGDVAGHATAKPSLDVIWGWCGVFDGDQKVVRTFERYRADAGEGHLLKGGTSNLRCGSSEESGYRHIQAGHRSQWEFDAWLVGTNWRNQAGFAIMKVLGDPDRVTYNPRNDSLLQQVGLPRANGGSPRRR